MTRTAWFFGLLFCFSDPGFAGVFLGTVDCTGAPSTESFCVQGRTVGGAQIVTPFAITHPMGFDGSGGEIELRICIDSSMFPSQELESPTRRAIAIWNELLARTGQCRNCYLVEEAANSPGNPVAYKAESVLLHELGHCALGLGHPDLLFDPPGSPEGREASSFTMSYGGSPVGIMAGGDDIRGSFDDIQQAPLGKLPESVHWFRIADNDPVIVDATVIDSLTYSRSITSNLPSGHGWAANANRAVAESLGFPETHAVMYSRISRGARISGLTADEVNMAKLAATGVDRLAGTKDDYRVTLVLVDDCANADIEISFLPLPFLAGCSARVDYSFPQPNPNFARHYSVVPPPGSQRLAISLDSSADWDFSVLVFSSGFETGDLSDWGSSAP